MTEPKLSVTAERPDCRLMDSSRLYGIAIFRLREIFVNLVPNPQAFAALLTSWLRKPFFGY